MPLTILLIGAENPRVQDLFKEVSLYAKVDTMNIGPMPARRLPLAGSNLDSTCSQIHSQFGYPDVIVFTWPQLAPLAKKFPQSTRVYYCKDPFEHWTCWDKQETRDQESKLLENVDAVFAVSRLLVEDFRPRTPAKVFYLPNAVEDSYLHAPIFPRPTNLPTDKPILGCVGQINSTYDWQYIIELAANLPQARLCLIGNISEENPDLQKQIAHHLTTTPNILYLGHQPHDQIPAYLQHFDIAFSPLKVDDYADRRSPLRLYDYLTTDKPIISTPIREAREHLPHIHLGATAEEAATIARQVFAGSLPVNIPDRKAYIASQTWTHRAKQFLIELLKLPKLADCVSRLTSSNS